MKEMFEIDDEYNVVLSPQMLMIPEFNKLVKLDRGSEGDYRGDKKLKARKQLAYVWFTCSFLSWIYDWDPGERHLEALKYTSLTEEDVTTPQVQDASVYYTKIQLAMAKSLKTLEAVDKALAHADTYFNELKMSEVDKLGRLKNSMKEVLGNIKLLEGTYAARDAFERRVLAELKAGGTGVRGKNSKLGGKEGVRKEWKEGGTPMEASTSMLNMTNLTSRLAEYGDAALLEEEDEV